MRLTEMTGDGVDLIRLPQDRDTWRDVVKAVMNFRVLYNVLFLLTGLGTVSFSTRTLIHGVSVSVCWWYFRAVKTRVFHNDRHGVLKSTSKTLDS
jgi:hypothetical protein